jgi:hypothetical protein
MSEIPYGEYLRSVSLKQNEISYNDLTKGPAPDQKIKVGSRDIYNILNPYVKPRIMEQLKAVIPLAIYLILFQIFILRQGVENSLSITLGLSAVIVGLMLFMEGLKLGLMPLGEVIGNTLPTQSPLYVVLFIVFLLGVGVTFAEPAIGALKDAGSIVSPEKAPMLYYMLNQKTDAVVLVVGAGVGLAAVLGTLRFVFDWSLKPMIFTAVGGTMLLTLYAQFINTNLREIIGLAWDCGAVTTGPVTVPLVLSLGIGVASVVGKGESKLSGFGIVTLASLFPIMGVLILGIVIGEPPANVGPTEVSETTWLSQSPALEVIGAMRAIVPLVLFLFAVMKFVLHKKIPNFGLLMYGIALTVLGMAVFSLGLTFGLSALGTQSGSLVPGAFLEMDTVEGSPLYFYALGIGIAFMFAWFLGFGATLAEPALNALGMTVQNLTHGAFQKKLLMYSVSTGVATGIALGVLKVIYGWQLAFILIPGYIFLLTLTYFSTEEFVNVAWDSAGVTTGPVTVPLVLAMGLGLGKAVTALEGFGVLSLASLCPIISVLICGLYIQKQEKKRIAVSEG